MPGTLYLVPTGLADHEVARFIPPATVAAIHALRRFVVEDAKSARRFLAAVSYPVPLREAVFDVLDEHTPLARIPGLLEPLIAGVDAGLMSEAGCPAVADPGARLVRAAHAAGIRVSPLVGPSALLLALMASGTNGQRFAFHGYLPVDAAQRRKRLVQLEARSAREDAAQLFIETPYRNAALFQAILEACQPETLLGIAVDLTAPSEMAITRTIAEWKSQAPDLARRPAVFVLYRGAS